MEKLPRQEYTVEFKENAVKLVLEQSMSTGMAAKRLAIPSQTLDNWIRKVKAGKSFKSGSHTVTDTQAEIARLMRENAELRMERDNGIMSFLFRSSSAA
jgi:transposase-like protein